MKLHIQEGIEQVDSGMFITDLYQLTKFSIIYKEGITFESNFLERGLVNV